MTLVFTKPTSTFELEFAFGEPKYSPFTIDMEGCGEAGTGHNNYFSGKTAFPPCPKDCWGNGWRDGGKPEPKPNPEPNPEPNPLP